jgi:hypothetical protein
MVATTGKTEVTACTLWRMKSGVKEYRLACTPRGDNRGRLNDRTSWESRARRSLLERCDEVGEQAYTWRLVAHRGDAYAGGASVRFLGYAYRL